MQMENTRTKKHQYTKSVYFIFPCGFLPDVNIRIDQHSRLHNRLFKSDLACAQHHQRRANGRLWRSGYESLSPWHWSLGWAPLWRSLAGLKDLGVKHRRSRPARPRAHDRTPSREERGTGSRTGGRLSLRLRLLLQQSDLCPCVARRRCYTFIETCAWFKGTHANTIGKHKNKQTHATPLCFTTQLCFVILCRFHSNVNPLK